MGGRERQGPRSKSNSKSIEKKRIEKVQAPYTFVPLSSNVVEAPGEARSSGLQDVPVGPEAYSGVLEVKVHTDTPVFIGGKADGDQKETPPYRTPDGQFALPGSSLRGMLRNVVEIATFGALETRVNDHRYGVRDLHNRDLYTDHMAALAAVDPSKRGKDVPYPLVCAGMLRPVRDEELPAGKDREDYPAVLDVRSFAKVPYEELIRHAAQVGVRNFDPGKRQSAPEKYEAWGHAPLQVGFEVDEWVAHGKKEAGHTRHGAFGLARLTGGRADGRLVFTGQPSKWTPDLAKKKNAGKPKHHDFLFYGEHGTLLVDRKTLDDFRFIHSDRGQQNRLTDSPNTELKYLLETCGGGAKSVSQWITSGRGGSLPVFFLAEERSAKVEVNNGVKVRAIGLAMMFRLAYRHSVGETVRASQPWSGREDLADRIFGYVPLGRKEKRPPHLEDRIARKGRVWVGDARVVDAVLQEHPVTAILSAPKASFYPNYVEQGTQDPGSQPLNGFTSWHDEGARPRGWKRVPPRQEVDRPYIPSKVKDLGRVGTTFRPWRATKGLVFKLRFHNLSPEELGAVVWALDFGGRSELRHTIGLAKQLGYGSIRLQVQGGSVRSTRDWEAPLEGAELDTLVQSTRGAFADFMEDALEGRETGGWAGSRPLFELLESARVQEEGQRHLRIDDPTHGNEFIAAKKQQLALPSIGNDVVWRRALHAREQELAAAREQREQAAHAEALAAMQDSQVPSDQRIEAWATSVGVTRAVDELRRWFGFKGAYEGEPDAVLAHFDPDTTDLMPAVAAFLQAHSGLSKQSKLLSKRQELLQKHLDVVQGSTSAENVTVGRRPFEGELVDWSKLGKKKAAKARAKWVTTVANDGPWDHPSLERIVAHLRAQGAPEGQINELRRGQARLLGITPEELGI